ncbi:Gfo/Idh/MocA family protein [Rathayibacter sp. CAU 1779]
MKQFGVGVVGANPDRGWASRSHIPAILASDGFRLAAVATTSPQSATAAQERFGAGAAYTDVASLVNDPAVDLVLVSVRASGHAGPILRAIEAGKDVVSDWPLAESVVQARELTRRAQSATVRHFVALQGRFAPAVERARQSIAAGAIGDPSSVTVYSSRAKGSGAPVPAWTAYTYDSAEGAGLVEVLGGHTLDILQHVLGPIVALRGSSHIRRRQQTIAETDETVDVTSPDLLVAVAEFAGGAVATIQLHDGEASTPRSRIEIMGSSGDLAIVSSTDSDPRAAQLQITGLELDLAGDWPDVWHRVDTSSGSHLSVEVRNTSRLYEAIYADLTTGSSSAPTFDTALQVHELLAAIESPARRDRR